MYECPNCAGNLKFDIASQMLLCEHCNTHMDPYSVHKEQDAEEHQDEYEVTVFICPQCGGEIISEDTTAATFCSFCGAATILDSRITTERRPAHIIPFAKTKEDCKEAYGKMMRRAFFAPKEFKEKENIEKFRGIYMPFWVYSFGKNGAVNFNGRKSYRKGDYIYTDHYRIETTIEESYQGVTYDASASFADSLSSAVSPFDLRNSKEFTPSFLSGFYADTSDVDPSVYEYEAEDMVAADSAKNLYYKNDCIKYNADRDEIKEAVRPREMQAELAMLPVWFLSYRNKDRVSYAVVNGQTGKVAAEIPVDPKKYLLGSIVLAIPLFLLLNLFFTITPTKMLFIAVLLAIVCMLIANVQITNFLVRESGEEDKGLMAERAFARSLADDMAEGREEAQEKVQRKMSPTTKTILAILAIVFFCVFFFPVIVPAILFLLLKVAPNAFSIIMFFCVAWPIVYRLITVASKTNKYERKRKAIKRSYWGNWKEKISTLVKPLIGVLTALVIFLINPVSDWYYYIGVCVCLATVVWAAFDIMRHHNKLTTRKLPQFNRRGGDESEW